MSCLSGFSLCSCGAKALVAIFVLLLAVPSYQPLVFASSSFPIPSEMLVRDYWPTAGWRNSTPEDQGMSSATLDAMITHIEDSDLDVHSVIVTRHGYVVLEEYPNPFQGQSRTQSYNGTHYLYSVTKSFTSCLIGIAIQEGLIDNTSQTVLSFFPDMTFENVDDWKERMTLWDLLTMNSGLPWDETSAPFSSPENDVWQVNYNSSGGVQYVLDRPMEHEPDTYYLYNTGASHVLSGIVEQVANMTTLQFATQYLFTPLNISPVYWPTDTKGVNFGGFDLQIRPLDMAKFGYLYLNNGTWDGLEIVSEDWVQNTTTTVTTLSSSHSYAAQWHTMPDRDAYFAAGLYGQYIFVAPELDIVAVFTSGYGLSDIDENPQMFRDYILSAVTDASPAFDPMQIGLIVISSVAVLAIVVLYIKKYR